MLTDYNLDSATIYYLLQVLLIRSRSPSPGGRRDDAEATSDPRTLDARVFVGSIPPWVTQDMLKKHFSKYGEVKGTSSLVLCEILIIDFGWGFKKK